MQSFAQTFDANSRRTQLAATIGSTADFKNDYTFDNLNRLTQVTQQDVIGGNAVADKRVDFAYLADGQFDEINRYASLNTSEFVAKSEYGYDGTGRLTSLSHVQGGTTFAGYGWAFDAANRITAFTNSQYAAEDATYSYDDASQLIGADRTGSLNDEAYTFDDNGNRVTANGDTYTTTANNRMSSDGTFNYTYDDEGNTLTKVRISNDPANDKTVEYTWDHRNRLTSVTFKNNGGTVTQKVEYVYDAFDRYIVRRHDTDGDNDIDESTNFIFDPGAPGHVALTLDDAGNVQNRYLHGPAVDMVLADEQTGGDLLWLLADNQGTIRDLASYDAGTDTTTVENHRTYNSFGKITAETNAAIDSVFAYTGRILDEVTGDQNYRARWYDVYTGRWLSEDPIKDGTNWSTYTRNAPANFTDPSGLLTWGDAWAGMTAGAHQFFIAGPTNIAIGAGNAAKETVLWGTDVVCVGVDAAATAAGYPIGYQERSSVGRSNNPSNPNFTKDAIKNAARAGLAGGTAGASEVIIGTAQFAQDGNSDAFQQHMGGVAGSTLVGAAVRSAQLRSTRVAPKPKRTFIDDMSPDEAARYEKYWKQGHSVRLDDAGNPINTRPRECAAPGTRSIVDQKLSSETGELYLRETIYDDFGRRIGNNDFTSHGRDKVHPNPHHHPNSPFDPKQHGPVRPGIHPLTPKRISDEH